MLQSTLENPLHAFCMRVCPHLLGHFIVAFITVIDLGTQYLVHTSMQIYSLPPMNIVSSHAVLNALFNCLREAHSRQDVKAIVVTGAKGRFSAGFDINQFAKSGGGGIDSRCNKHPQQLGTP